MEWITTLTPECAKDPLHAISQPPDGAGVVELRLDLFPGIHIPAAISACPLPVLATCRSTVEGGRGPDDSAARIVLLRQALESGAALIDLEFRRDRGLYSDLGLAPEQVVLSWHDVNGTPADLELITAEMMEGNARWIKVVPTTGRLADLKSTLGLHPRFNESRPANRRLITFGMGTAGMASRLLAPMLGPPVAFAAWQASAPAAPGQIPLDRMRALLGSQSGVPKRLFGVVGADVSGSLSPEMHNAAYRALGLPYFFLPVSAPLPEDLPLLFTPGGLFSKVGLEVGGWAVTTPYKAQAARFATLQAPRVQRARAANTLLFKGERVIAENTDADGVVGALTSIAYDAAGKIAVVQGTGGASRGAAVGLDLAGADVILRGRDEENTRAVAEEIGVGWAECSRESSAAHILVNATPLGSGTGDVVPFSEAEINGAEAVVDMVYGAEETILAAQARRKNLKVVDGLDVLAHQGFAQFAAMTGQLPPKEAMRQALSANADR